MATISSAIQLTLLASRPTLSSSSPSLPKLNSRFLGGVRGKRLGWCRPSGLGPGCGSRTTCWFKFGKNGVDAEGAGIYGSQARDDVEQGSYDKMESQNIHPVDILLLMAASEGDKPKIEELLRAGADYTVKDADGRTG